MCSVHCVYAYETKREVSNIFTLAQYDQFPFPFLLYFTAHREFQIRLAVFRLSTSSINCTDNNNSLYIDFKFTQKQNWDGGEAKLWRWRFSDFKIIHASCALDTCQILRLFHYELAPISDDMTGGYIFVSLPSQLGLLASSRTKIKPIMDPKKIPHPPRPFQSIWRICTFLKLRPRLRSRTFHV